MLFAGPLPALWLFMLAAARSASRWSSRSSRSRL